MYLYIVGVLFRSWRVRVMHYTQQGTLPIVYFTRDDSPLGIVLHLYYVWRIVQGTLSFSLKLGCTPFLNLLITDYTLIVSDKFDVRVCLRF